MNMFGAGKPIAMGRFGSLKRKLENYITTPSFCSLSYDKSIASFKANSPQRAI
jgi:hypothetical protein